jgi:hypothetical protein
VILLLTVASCSAVSRLSVGRVISAVRCAVVSSTDDEDDEDDDDDDDDREAD